jgi:protein HIRA/HIR1
MHIIKPSWLSHSGEYRRLLVDGILGMSQANSTLGEQKDFEVYSCHVSPDGKRLATAGGGM